MSGCRMFEYVVSEEGSVWGMQDLRKEEGINQENLRSHYLEKDDLGAMCKVN